MIWIERRGCSPATSRIPSVLCDRLTMDPEIFNKAVEKLCSQGAAQLDMEGHVRATGVSTWRSGYRTQLAYRRAQLEAIVRIRGDAAVPDVGAGPALRGSCGSEPAVRATAISARRTAGCSATLCGADASARSAICGAILATLKSQPRDGGGTAL